MSRVKARAGFGEASEFEALDISIDFDEVRPDYLPAVTETVPVLGDDGLQLEDPETGAPLTKEETVSFARYETQEEALARVLKQHLTIDEVTKEGVENIRASISFTVTGTIDFDAQDWGLDDDLDELDPDDVDDYWVRERFEDSIIEAIHEAASSSWESEVEFDVDIDEVE